MCTKYSSACTNYSSVLGKLRLHVKLFLSTVDSVGSFFSLITFVLPLPPPANCSVSALNNVILGIGFFLRGFTQIMQFTLLLLHTVEISPPAHPALIPMPMS